jgi:hypothetical protein
VLELGELQAAARPLGLQLDTLEIRRPARIQSGIRYDYSAEPGGKWGVIQLVTTRPARPRC